MILTRMYKQNKEAVDQAVLARLQEEHKLQKTQDSHETQWVSIQGHRFNKLQEKKLHV